MMYLRAPVLLLLLRRRAKPPAIPTFQICSWLRDFDDDARDRQYPMFDKVQRQCAVEHRFDRNHQATGPRQSILERLYRLSCCVIQIVARVHGAGRILT
jgi:hypothetical protein